MKRDLARAITDYLAVSGSSDERATKLANFDRGDWERGLEWLDQTGLALWLWGRLKVSGADDAVPSGIAARLERNMADHSTRVEAMAEEFDSINRRFEADGIEYVVLKGFALAPEYVADARLRPAYDYDYLVQPESAERVSRALGNGGYIRRRERVDHPVVYVHTSRLPRAPSCRDELYSAGLPRSVEVHTRLWEPEALKIPLPLPDDFLARKRPRTWQGLRFYSLSEEDELLFQVLHAFRHIIECWCRLYTFLEIAHFLEQRQTDLPFWQRFVERLSLCPRLPEMAGVVFSLAVRLFGAPIPAAIDAGVLHNLRRPLLLWVNRYGYNSALANFTGNKYSLLLYREFVPDDATWREIQRKRLFPMHRPNHVGGGPTRGISERLIAGWKQSAYVARRLSHHLIAAAQYEWESIQWERIRMARRLVPLMTGSTATPTSILFLEQQAHRAGAQRVLAEVLRALDPDYLPIVGLPEEGPFAEEIRRRGIETFLYPLGRYASGRKPVADMTKLALRSLYCGWLLARLIRRRGIRLVYINGPRSLIAGALAARLTGRPAVFHLHLTMTRTADIFVTARAAKHVTRILACSETTAAALLANHLELKSKLQVVYNPVRELCAGAGGAAPTGERRADTPNGRAFVVGVVGRITPQKGQHVLLDAALELARRGKTLRVIFVGAPGPHSFEDDLYLSSLKLCVKDSSLENQVTWAGYQEDPTPLYAACDVVVIPSTVSEGLPMVAIEAMQLGIPVIGSNVGGIPEIVRDGVNGFLVPPHDAKALADRVQQIFDDGELLMRMKAQALASVDGRFSTGHFALAIRGVIDECLSGRSAIRAGS